MSTPRTDELAKREFVPDGVWINHARDLERENAALKKQLKDMTDQFFTVSAENATLREALHDIMTESDEQVIWRMARAALDGKEKP